MLRKANDLVTVIMARSFVIERSNTRGKCRFGSVRQLDAHFAAGRILFQNRLVTIHLVLQKRLGRDVPDTNAYVLLWVGIEIGHRAPPNDAA